MDLLSQQRERDPVLSSAPPSLTYTVLGSAPPSLTYTCLYLKRETDRWDSRGNYIVQATKDIADKIYHMAQYLRRKGPIQVWLFD